MTLRSSAPQAIEFSAFRATKKVRRVAPIVFENYRISIFRTIKYIMILSPQFLRAEEQRNLVNER